MKFAQDTLYVTDLDGTLLGEEPRIPEEAVLTISCPRATAIFSISLPILP